MSESIKFGNKQLPSFRELTKHLDGDRSSFNTQAVPTRIMLFPRHYSLESLPRPYVFSPHHKSPRTNNYLPKLSISSSINMNSGPGSPSSSSPKSLPRPPKFLIHHLQLLNQSNQVSPITLGNLSTAS